MSVTRIKTALLSLACKSSEILNFDFHSCLVSSGWPKEDGLYCLWWCLELTRPSVYFLRARGYLICPSWITNSLTNVCPSMWHVSSWLAAHSSPHYYAPVWAVTWHEFTLAPTHITCSPVRHSGGQRHLVMAIAHGSPQKNYNLN